MTRRRPSSSRLGLGLIVLMCAFVAFGGYIAFPEGAHCRGHRPSSSAR